MGGEVNARSAAKESGIRLVVLGLFLTLASASSIHAARGALPQACADRMAGFADAAAVARPPSRVIELTAEERASAQVIRGALESCLSNRQVNVFPEIRGALAQAPHLLERDPDSALRFAWWALFYSDYREYDSLTRYLGSGLRFEGATLSKTEVKEVIRLMRNHPLYSGLLGHPYFAPGISGDGQRQAMDLAREKFKISVAYSFFRVVASQADAGAKAELRSFDVDSWHNPLRERKFWEGMFLVAPHGRREAEIWMHAFRRLFQPTNAPRAYVHVVENGLIRVSASDPFKGANPGLVGFERVFNAGEFRELAESAGQDGLVLPVDGTRGGFKISRSILDELGRISKAAPPYEAWSQDGKVQGLIWTDTGFGAADASETMGEYLSFYRAQGFKFKKQQVADFPEWIESRVRSGELDYMVREGHEQMRLHMFRSGELMVGRKSGAPTQEVVLFIPNSRSQDTELTWSALNQALNSRAERHPQNSLLYFDTKCSSFSGTTCQLPGLAKSSQIQVVSSKSTASTFVNDETSPLRALMEGILEQDSYSKMNSRLQAARKRAAAAADDAAADDYIFPNSDEYRKAVTDKEMPGGALEWVEK